MGEVAVERPAKAAPGTTQFAIGLGLTNECNLSCAFCYRDPDRVDRLSVAQVRSVMERMPVRSVNLGTGENGLHPDFKQMLEYLRSQPIKLTMTSNGFSVAEVGDADLPAFADIEFSLDYPSEAEQDAQRGAGNWRLLHEQATRCRRLGVPVTFIAVMMRTNFDRLAEVAEIAKQYDAPLRINVYQAVRTDTFALSYEQVLDRVRDPVGQDRRHCDRRTAGSRDGGPATANRRVWCRDGAGDAPRDRAAVRVLAGHRRTA